MLHGEQRILEDTESTIIHTDYPDGVVNAIWDLLNRNKT